MMGRFNIFFVIGIGFLMYIAGSLITSYGEIPECKTEPYTLVDTFFTFIGICSLFVFGYLAGKFEEE